MSVLQRLGEQLNRGQLAELRETISQQAGNLELLQERLVELERDDIGWQRIGQEVEREFSRQGLRNINHLTRLFWLKNPLIQRGVNIQAHYVFGQGVNVQAEDDLVNGVVQQFMGDAKNQAELTSHQARMLKETELTLFGNLFFVLFPNKLNGRLRVRTIPVDEVDDVICNPEDSKDPWYYRRSWTQRSIGGETTQHEALYPDWRYTPATKPQSVQVGGATLSVQWESPVYHVRVGCLTDMRFGVSEVYAALDWAKAYKNFLEDWSTIVRAYARFAWNVRVKGGSAAVSAAKTKLGSTYGSSTTATESNPPPVTGAAFIAQQGVGLSPVRTAGATTSAEDGRRLLLMVAASTGLPESFFGDVSVGTLATAKSLDRPTELKMLARQTLWADIFRSLCAYAIEWAVRAPRGLLRGSIEADDDGTPIVHLEQVEDPETGELRERDATVRVDFPELLEHDVGERVGAIVDAATLRGMPPAGTMGGPTLTRLLLSALGEEDIDALMETLYPPDEETPDGVVRPAEAQMAEAVGELREAISQFVRRYGNHG